MEYGMSYSFGCLVRNEAIYIYVALYRNVELVCIPSVNHPFSPPTLKFYIVTMAT